MIASWLLGSNHQRVVLRQQLLLAIIYKAPNPAPAQTPSESKPKIPLYCCITTWIPLPHTESESGSLQTTESGALEGTAPVAQGAGGQAGGRGLGLIPHIPLLCTLKLCSDRPGTEALVLTPESCSRFCWSLRCRTGHLEGCARSRRIQGKGARGEARTDYETHVGGLIGGWRCCVC